MPSSSGSATLLIHSAEPHHVHDGSISSLSTSPPDPSPVLSHRTAPSISGLEVDRSLSSAIAALINYLLAPLSKTYSPTVLSELRLRLTESLTERFSPTWDEEHPQFGSGHRSLICDRRFGLPRPLRQSAHEVGVNEKVWIHQLARSHADHGRKISRETMRWDSEWQAWCDPGTVFWRYGGWDWDDVGFEPTVLSHRETADRMSSAVLTIFIGQERCMVIWQAPSNLVKPSSSAMTLTSDSQAVKRSVTPARVSHAIPIRAPLALPAVYAVPPTPVIPLERTTVISDHAENSPSDLLPSARISRTPSPAGSDASSNLSFISHSEGGSTSARNTSMTSSHPSEIAGMTKPPSRGSHRGCGSGSTSSNDSNESDNSSHVQPVTPAIPASAELFGGPLLPHETDSHTDIDNLAISPATTAKQPFEGRGRDPSPSGTAPHSPMSPNSASASQSVTPYDGGNVTVLGGGVKLGGGSRAGSIASHSRTPQDRSRSPSVSLASRALSSALGPGMQKKSRTRRRIMPTYLGHVGQPGIGGPVQGPFGPLSPQPPWTASMGVGVGLAPPPVNPRATGGGMPRLGSR